MPSRPVQILFAILMTATVTVSAQPKQQARVAPMSQTDRENIIGVQSLTTNDTCIGSPVDNITHIIQDWVFGNELYKNYIDPTRNGCTYPYTITEINMPMYFVTGASFPVEVDIEAVDNLSVPGCHVPGEVIALSSSWDVTIPDTGGFYDIWIPLDTPVTVTSPFFAGFFLGAAIDASTGVAIAIDTTTLEECISFNIWDETIGFIDLANNDYWNFPGQLVLYVSGYSTEGSVEPEPIVSFVNPVKNSVLYGETELWARDLSGSGILEYVSFDYSDGGPWMEIGTDFDGTSPLRDGLNTTISGTGFSIPWDLSGMAEGTYSLRATLVDTLGRVDQELMLVDIEPTPPLPIITSPDDFADFCNPVELIMYCGDENISSIQVEWQTAENNYSAGLTSLNQQLLGDVDGDPNDGNPVADGEFGDYYNGPAAAAIAAKLWYDRGYTEVMKEGTATLTIEMLAESLAADLLTRELKGTYDENFVQGLREYFAAHGDDLALDYVRRPDYLTLRKWVESDQKSVLIGVNGLTGFWLAVDGFQGWPVSDTALVSVSIPMTGTIVNLPWRSISDLNEIQYNGEWYGVDIAVSMLGKKWNIDRNVAGIDFMANDGWSIVWNPGNLEEDRKYYLRPWTQDADQNEGYTVSLLTYNCSQVYLPGDYDGNQYVDIGDLSVLIDFITIGGAPPAGGIERADANCDNLINAADIVYFMNYLFGKNDDPCY